MRNTIIFLFLITSFTVSAQTQILKGRIVDSKSQEGIAYTNIGVEGTFYGTASDAEGFFELKVPSEFQSEKLYISAVGYKNENLNLPEVLAKDFNLIRLVSQTYDIEGIDVAAQSRVLFRILKTASENIPKNYFSGPTGMKIFYSEEIIKDDKTKSREAVIQIFDEAGYKNPSVADAYKSRNFRFAHTKRNFDPYSFAQGSTGFEELLEMDVVRSSSTILNTKLLNDYDLQLEGTSIFDGDSVWIISYKTDQTDLPHTGDFYTEKVDGKIYISKTDYGIIRNECAIEASMNNSQNRSLSVKENAQKNVKYHFTATYKKHSSKYALAYLDCQKTFNGKNNKPISSHRKASVLDVNSNPLKFAGKHYFEDNSYVANFWDSFKKPF